MSINQKETNRESDEISRRLPSRSEVHGQKNRKRNRKNSGEKETSKQKKIKITIPLILLVVLLLLPGAYAMYLSNKEKAQNSTPENGIGEEISFAEDNSIESSTDQKDPSNTPVVDEELEDEKKVEEQGKENADTEENKSEGENTEQKAKEQEAQPPVKETEKVNEEQKAEEPPVQQEEAKIVYHTVKKGETLFRISMQYYKNQSGIEKIKEANGITGNEIKEGQSLKIPLP